jgi:hypothetical protein
MRVCRSTIVRSGGYRQAVITLTGLPSMKPRMSSTTPVK